METVRKIIGDNWNAEEVRKLLEEVRERRADDDALSWEVANVHWKSALRTLTESGFFGSDEIVDPGSQLIPALPTMSATEISSLPVGGLCW